MAKVEAVTGSGEFTCECGRGFTHGAWYTKHRLKCDGKPVQTRGRIERLAAKHGTPPTSRRASVASRAVAIVRDPNYGKREQQPAGIAAIAAAATDKAIEVVIAGLMAKRAQIDAAITSLQALG